MRGVEVSKFKGGKGNIVKKMMDFSFKFNLLRNCTFRSQIPKFLRTHEVSVQARNPSKIMAQKRMDLPLPNLQNNML